MANSNCLCLPDKVYYTGGGTGTELLDPDVSTASTSPANSNRESQIQTICHNLPN